MLRGDGAGELPQALGAGLSQEKPDLWRRSVEGKKGKNGDGSKINYRSKWDPFSQKYLRDVLESRF